MAPLSAVLLAAGRSMRMGQEKALLEIQGMPLWRWQRALLASAGATEVFLSVRPEQTWAYHAEGFSALVHDAMPDCGPISGITAGLERMSQSHLIALAIDLPDLSAAWFSTLLAHCEPGAGAVGQREGFFEPLAAIYPQELKWLAWETMARGEYSLQVLLGEAVKAGRMRVVEITDEQVPWFRNWNRPEK